MTDERPTLEQRFDSALSDSGAISGSLDAEECVDVVVAWLLDTLNEAALDGRFEVCGDELLKTLTMKDDAHG